MLACRMLRELAGEAGNEGQVRGTVLPKGFYGTVQPLRLDGPEGKLGAVWARFVLVTSVLLFFASAPCWREMAWIVHRSKVVEGRQ